MARKLKLHHDETGTLVDKYGHPVNEDGSPIIPDTKKEFLEHKRSQHFQGYEDVPPKRLYRYELNGLAKAAALMLGVFAFLALVAFISTLF